MDGKETAYAGVVGLTGSIGSGKSTAAALFADLGAHVVHADDLAREAVRSGSDGLQEIAIHFGSGFITDAGELDRKALGLLVFKDASQRRKLEEIVHPRVAALAQERFKAAPPGRLLLYDCPLLFESGIHLLGFDKIIVVTAPQQAALERIVARDGLSREQALARLNAQMPQSEKARLADIVIENAGSIADLRAAVSAVYQTLASALPLCVL